MKKCTKKIPRHNAGAIVGNGLNFVADMASNVEQSRENGVTFGSVLGGMGKGASTGATLGSVIPGIGTVIGGIGGAIVGGVTSAVEQSGSVDENTGAVTKSSGLTRLFNLGRSDDALYAESNRIKTSNLDKQLTPYMNYKFMQNPNNHLNTNIYVNAAEGGIMRKQVDALVSKGELIYNPVTKKLNKVPGSKGKPNKEDDVYARLSEGDVVISNSPTMLMANGKTPAQNLEGLVDSDRNVKAKEAIIKKVVNWQEANKTKPQEYGTLRAANGWDGIIKSWDDYLKKTYTLSKDNDAQELNDFWGYDSKAGKYTNNWDKIIKYIGSNKDLKAKAIKDLSGLSYIGNGADAWDNIVKAAHDKNVRDVHRYFRQVGDDLVHNQHLIDYTPSHGVVINRIQEPFINKRKTKTNLPGATLINSYENSGANKKLTELTPEQLNASALHYSNLKWPDEKRSNKFGDALDSLTGLAPLAAAITGNYDYHTEQPQISSYRYIPTGVSIEPVRRAANESYAMARYNQANLNPNTGAGMAYGLQAASNRAKTLADAYTWQQDAQNKLIAQNTGIYNDWAKQYDAARYQAIADTRANEGAAQQMKDQRYKDFLEMYYGRRNDKMKMAMLEPLFDYAVDDSVHKLIKRMV